MRSLSRATARRRFPLAACALLALGLAPRSAGAFCRTASCPDGVTGTACTPSVKDCSGGVPIAWGSPCVSFWLQKDASSRIDLATAKQVFDAAFATWMDASCPGGGTPHIRIGYGGTVACNEHEYNQKTGNANAIIFRDDGWPYQGGGNTLALTTVTYNLDTGEIYDADMELNSAGTGFTTADTGVVFDLPSIVTHEAGHFLGIAHSAVSDSTMFPDYKPGSTTLRDLTADDVSAICAAYPPGGAIPSTCDTTPRHGFESDCYAGGSGDDGGCDGDTKTDGCCTVAPGAGGKRGSPSSGAVAIALGAAAAAARRRPRPPRPAGPAAAPPRAPGGGPPPGPPAGGGGARGAPPPPAARAPPPPHDEAGVTGGADPPGSARRGGDSAPSRPLLARTEAEVVAVAARCALAPAVAVDVEADGLFAFRPKLCTAQLAWEEGGRVVVAVVDALATRIDPLAPLLGELGPAKVLHDLTFDAKLLAESGAPLGRVRDTSVAARLLGHTATGLAALVSGELGIALDKRLQHHDWSRRPLAEAELGYLAEDVAHLLALDARLAERAAALDLCDEIADECAYKLACASAPPRDARPAYARIKGAADLDAVGRAVLRRLVEAREAAAAAADVPAFKVIGNEALLELARRRPRSTRALEAIRGAVAGRAGRHVPAWLTAIEVGIADGAIPAEDGALFERTREPRGAVALRRAREAQLATWRRAEAERRGVSEQAILPGHCAQEIVAVLLAADAGALAAAADGAIATTAPVADEPSLRARIAAVPGLGARRLERYGEALVALARTPAPPLGAASGAERDRAATPASERTEPA